MCSSDPPCPPSFARRMSSAPPRRETSARRRRSSRRPRAPFARRCTPRASPAPPSPSPRSRGRPAPTTPTTSPTRTTPTTTPSPSARRMHPPSPITSRRASRPRTQGNHPYPARVLAPLLRRPRRSRHRPAGQRQDPRLPSPRGGVCAAGRARQTENQTRPPRAAVHARRRAHA